MEIEHVLNNLGSDKKINLEDIPDIDLYMDQVIQLFKNAYKDTRRNEKDKLLTKTMINNYAKGKLFFPIKNKKYTKEHVMLVSLIYQLKGTLSINEIKESLNGINEKVMTDELNLADFYQSTLDLMDQNVLAFTEEAKEIAIAAESKPSAKDDNYLEEILILVSLAHKSNLYRRAAERLADKIAVKKFSK
ncbi:DUF1836 domain-containing protein [Bacillus massilinigeriensis]|uniref:DUF1836 domain-containing protein n=1 Tax=Bacillus mediterraneensis TaxID=1805474 RepID=UPI0008F7EADC|nr:DUF1836 domain-containing protein [Bacillus mediterraneensis]